MGAVCDKGHGQEESSTAVPRSPKVGSPAISLRRCNSLSSQPQRRQIPCPMSSDAPPPSPHPRVRMGSFFNPAGLPEQPEAEETTAPSPPEPLLPLLDGWKHTKSFHISEGSKLDGNIRLTFKVQTRTGAKKSIQAPRLFPTLTSITHPLRSSTKHKVYLEEARDPRETLEAILSTLEAQDEDLTEGCRHSLRRFNTMPCRRPKPAITSP
eukprot:GGOE01013300.1.p1 GENE.GGOE01013300.1~~GGOE01013300.1.p1  ORF type:complete len:224 (-),score=35.10 GGOE01013300.1:1116-1745(-)